MLTLTFLGVGSAFAKRNYNSNALIEAWSRGPEFQAAPDETLLIDFGATGPLALHELGGKPGFEYLDGGGGPCYRAIRNVFITHLHADHVGGLEELALSLKLEEGPDPTAARRPVLWGARDLLFDLWHYSLRGGLGVFGGRIASLGDYFSVSKVDLSRSQEPKAIRLLDRYEFTPFQTDHIRLSQKFDWPSYGLVIKDRQSGETVVYSGDTRFDPETIGPRMALARSTFHEVQLVDEPVPVHALLSELRTLPADVRARMYLYHYSDSWDLPQYSVIAKEFRGFARAQERYVLFESTNDSGV